jgi:drug/metabolite transporter (DMT)-like permease
MPAMTSPETRQQPLRGVLLVAGAVLLFAAMDTTTKYLAASYKVPLIMAVRYAINLALMVVVFAPMQGKQLVQTRRSISYCSGQPASQ